jgi:plasmid stabilization system protein ParE
MRFTFTPEAERDMDEIIAYLLALPKAPALRIGGAIQRAIENIIRFPGLGRIDEKQTRLAHTEIHRFVSGKYILFYSVLKQSILIHGILDGRRDVENIMSDRNS